MSSTERSSHPSAAQIEALVAYLERNRSLAKGYCKTQSAREQVRLKWEQLALSLNSIVGTVKSAKQWTKYWTDKKSATKKKAAARAAARRRTGGGVEDVIELSEVEERIIALLGGEGYFTGDQHLGIQPFREPSQQTPEETQQAGTSEESMIPHQRSPASEEIIHAIVLEPEQSDDDDDDEDPGISQPSLEREQPDEPGRVLKRRTLVRRLFASPGSSQSSDLLPRPGSSLNPPQTPRPTLSPPPLTLSRTPTPLSIPRSSAQSRMGPPQSVPSPSRSGATSQGRSERTRRGRASQGAGSTSRQSATSASPPSQRRREFSRITERFLRVEEQQLELQRLNSRLVERVLQQSAERQQDLVQVVTALGERMIDQMAHNGRLVAEAMGDGLKALAEAIQRP